MSTKEVSRSFPYHEIWEDFTEERVTLEDLWPRLMIFRTRFRLLCASSSPTPMVETDSILELMNDLDLAPSQKHLLAEQLYLVAGYYLGPEHLKQWQTDVRSSAQILRKIRKSSAELAKSLQQISSGVSRALNVLHAVDPDALESKSEIDTPSLSRLLIDLDRVSARMVGEISNRRRGRTNNFVRLNALGLALECTEASGLGRVTVSRGNKLNHEPHFTGNLGKLVRDFFRLIAPWLSERTLVKNVEQVRRSGR